MTIEIEGGEVHSKDLPQELTRRRGWRDRVKAQVEARESAPRGHLVAGTGLAITSVAGGGGMWR